MTDNRTISVIIPLYNSQPLIGAAIASLREQNITTLEIIVVDDGSTDNGAAVAAALGSDIRVIHQQNAGPAAARNHGIREARGEFIAFLDADDLFPPNKLATQRAYLQDHADILIVNGYVQLIAMLGSESNSPHAPGRLRNSPYLDFNLGSALFRRSVFDQVGLLDTSTTYGEDVDWWLRAEEHIIPMAILRQVTLLYRRHGSNLTSVQHQKLLENEFQLILRRALERRGVAPNTSDEFPRWSHLLVPVPEMPPPLVSVIVPILPNTHEIEKTLLSLAAQNYPAGHLEIVLVAQDEISRQSAQKQRVHLSKCRLATLDSETHEPIDFYNEGIRSARGDIIVFSESDSLWKEDHIAQTVAHLVANPHVEFVINGQNVLLPKVVDPKTITALGLNGNAQQALTLSILTARRSVFAKIGMFDLNYPFTAAYEWFTRALDANIPWGYLPQLITMRTLNNRDRILRNPALILKELTRIHFASLKRRQSEQKPS